MVVLDRSGDAFDMGPRMCGTKSEGNTTKGAGRHDIGACVELSTSLNTTLHLIYMQLTVIAPPGKTNDVGVVCRYSYTFTGNATGWMSPSSLTQHQGACTSTAIGKEMMVHRTGIQRATYVLVINSVMDVEMHISLGAVRGYRYTAE